MVFRKSNIFDRRNFRVASLTLAYFVSKYWLILAGLAGLNLIVFATTGFCTMANILVKFGLKSTLVIAVMIVIVGKLINFHNFLQTFCSCKQKNHPCNIFLSCNKHSFRLFGLLQFRLT